MAGVRAPPTARQAITALPVPATEVSPDGRGMDTFPPAPCTRWDVARCGEHSPGAVQLPLPTTSQVPAPLTHRSPAVLGESLRFHGHDLKLRRGALQQEAARSGLTQSSSPRTEHLPAVHPPAALAFSTHTRRFPRFCLRLGAAWGGQGGAGLGAGGCERGEERSVSALESFGMQRAGTVSSGMNAASPFLSRPCCHLPNSPQLPGKEAGMKPGRVV